MDPSPPLSRSRLRRSGRIARCAVALLLSIVGSIVHAQQAGTVNAPVPAPPFSPAIEKKLEAFFTTLAATKKENWEERMLQVIGELQKVTGLDAAAAEALKAPASLAIEECLKSWSSETQSTFRDYCSAQDGRGIDYGITWCESRSRAGVEERLAIGHPRPWEHPIWTGAVEKVLNPAQRAVWKTAEKVKAFAFQTGARALVKTWVQAQQAGTLGPLLARAREASHSLGLPAERAEKLRHLLEAAGEKRAAALQALGEKALLSGDTPDLQAFEPTMWDTRRITRLPTVTSDWEESLVSVLTAAELAGFKALKEEHRQRQARVIAAVFVAFFDEKVALTAAQREQLLPLALSIVSEESQFWSPEGAMYCPLYPFPFYRLGSKLSALEGGKVLDARQRERWSAVVDLKTAAIDTPVADPAPQEAEAAEAEISNVFFTAAENTRANYLSEVTLLYEDIVRTSAPDPETCSRLNTAARGAVERRMDSWRTTSEVGVRAVLNQQSALLQGDNLVRLRSIVRPYQNRAGEPLATFPFWAKTAENALTTAQRERWQKEVEARKEFVASTAAKLIVASFDSKLLISAPQCEALEPLIRKTFQEKSADLGIPRDSPPPRVFQQNPLTPLLLLETELKPILTPAQWDAWTSSEEYKAIHENWKRLQEQKKQNIIIAPAGVLRG